MMMADAKMGTHATRNTYDGFLFDFLRYSEPRRFINCVSRWDEFKKWICIKCIYILRLPSGTSISCIFVYISWQFIIMNGKPDSFKAHFHFHSVDLDEVFLCAMSLKARIRPYSLLFRSGFLLPARVRRWGDDETMMSQKAWKRGDLILPPTHHLASYPIPYPIKMESYLFHCFVWRLPDSCDRRSEGSKRVCCCCCCRLATQTTERPNYCLVWELQDEMRTRTKDSSLPWLCTWDMDMGDLFRMGDSTLYITLLTLKWNQNGLVKKVRRKTTRT